MNKKYLRNRPFLLIQITQTPSNRNATSVSGWGDNDKAWQYNESISIVDAVNSKELTRSAVVIDILEKKLIKDRFSNERHGTEDISIVLHYLEKYQKAIVESIDLWLRKVSSSSEETQRVIEQFQNEIQEN